MSFFCFLSADLFKLLGQHYGSPCNPRFGSFDVGDAVHLACKSCLSCFAAWHAVRAIPHNKPESTTMLLEVEYAWEGRERSSEEVTISVL